MTGKVFLNYRRSDAEAWADRVYERLVAKLPGARIFMDIDGNIPLGIPWANWLDSQVGSCDVMLVLIGRTWVAEFQSRTAPGEVDFVRAEIESALSRKVPCVPVFLGDAPIPAPSTLPPSLRALLDLQAARLQRASFDTDAQALIEGVERSIRIARGETVDATLPTKRSMPPAERYAAEGRIKVDAPIVHGAPTDPSGGGWFKPGAGRTEWFQDIDIGPQMVVVPADYPFAIGRFTLRFDEWDSAQLQFIQWVKHTGMRPRRARDRGWGRGHRPAIDISWLDSKAYCAWLNAITGKLYRLPTEDEWTRCCKAGTNTEFWWGNEASHDLARYGDQFGDSGTVPVDTYKPNPWGLYQMHGNVRQWCEDNHLGKSARILGTCWNDPDTIFYGWLETGSTVDSRQWNVGVRLARTLPA